MTRWYRSFRLRLITSFILVLGLALGGLAVFSILLVQGEADRYREDTIQGRMDSLAAQMVQRYEEVGWEGVGPVLNSARTTLGWQIFVRNPEGRLLAYSGDPLQPPQEREGVPTRSTPIFTSDGERLGDLVIQSHDAGLFVLDPSPNQMVAAFQQSLLWTGLAAGAAGVLLLFLVTRPMLVPVRQLTHAARRLRQGDRSQRVSPVTKDEIGELAEAFNAMIVDLDAAEAQRQRLFADIAHELRTPLTNTRGYLEAIADGVRNPDEKTIQAIHRQVLHLEQIVDDLRLLTIAESGALELRCVPTPLGDLLQATVLDFKPQAEGKGVTLGLESFEELPAMEVDGVRMAQALGNLVQNALTHTPPGGSVTVSGEHKGGVVAIHVTDTGSGIPEEALPHIFDRFYREDRSRSRSSGGSGLGLAIAKGLVEAHQGTLTVESTLGRGSRFTIYLYGMTVSVPTPIA